MFARYQSTADMWHNVFGNENTQRKILRAFSYKINIKACGIEELTKRMPLLPPPCTPSIFLSFTVSGWRAESKLFEKPKPWRQHQQTNWSLLASQRRSPVWSASLCWKLHFRPKAPSPHFWLNFYKRQIRCTANVWTALPPVSDAEARQLPHNFFS